MYFLTLAEKKDVDTCYEIIEFAKQFQKEQGFVQWTDDYPNREIIQDDVNTKKGYIIKEDENVLAYMCIDFAGEPSYEYIDGAWGTEEPYAVVHRMAFSKNYVNRGLSSKSFELIEDFCLSQEINNIRIDTDFKNSRMQHILEKNGFIKRGVIYFQGSERIAYDKKLKK